MLNLVGETQSAYVSGCQIPDGALIVSKTVHQLKNNTKSGCISKLNFQKAYDRVRWYFVDLVLQKMRFGERWMQNCISIASMSTLVNGIPTKPFRMEKGPRQGNPLYQFLLVLVTEVSTVWCSKLWEKGLLRHYKWVKESWIFHTYSLRMT